MRPLEELSVLVSSALTLSPMMTIVCCFAPIRLEQQECKLEPGKCKNKCCLFTKGMHPVSFCGVEPVLGPRAGLCIQSL